MSKYFIWVKKGDIRDLYFRHKVKFSEDCTMYKVYVGKLCIGQVSGRPGRWDAISYRDHDLPYSHTDSEIFNRIARSESWMNFEPTAEVLGFGTRLHAGFYLASHWKLRPERFDSEDHD